MVNFRLVIYLCSFLLFTNSALRADVTIPVTFGGTATCLSRLYSDIIVPSGEGTSTDTTAATRFAQSDAGTLGLTLFFEVRPNATAVAYTGLGAMEAITYTARNRTVTTGFVPSSYTTYKAITKNMSAVWVSKSDGSGNLQSTQSSALTTVLNEAPTSADCNGFILSMQMGLYYVAYYIDSIVSVYNFTPSDPEPLNLWFKSGSSSLPSSNAYLIGGQVIPNLGGVTYYFFGQNGVKLKPGNTLL